MNSEKRTISPEKRHRARKFAVQALYQWKMSGDNLEEISRGFLADMNHKKTDADYFSELTQGVDENVNDIDKKFIDFLDRKFEEIGPVELSILRLGTFELAYSHSVPYKSVMNEAIELAKTFGPEDSYKYINGVLDQVSKKYRIIERRNDEKDGG
jgi:transcription antitermination protein NusB